MARHRVSASAGGQLRPDLRPRGCQEGKEVPAPHDENIKRKRIEKLIM